MTDYAVERLSTPWDLRAIALPSPASADTLLAETVLHAIGPFTELLRLRRLDARPGWVHLQVVSRLATARDPLQERVLWETTLPAQTAQALGQTLARAHPGLH